MSLLPDAVLLLEKKLHETWSSPSVVPLLEARPVLLQETRAVFGNLNKIIKMRVLLALAAFEQISVLPTHHVTALLDEADQDKDEWVRVVSAQVREWLFPQDAFQKRHFGEGGPTLGPAAKSSEDIISKSEIRLFDPANKMVDPEPYFSPMEYLYLSEAIIQRHHVAAPLTRKKNPHFEVGLINKAVKMEAIPDQPPSLLPVIKPDNEGRGDRSGMGLPQLPLPSFAAPPPSQSTSATSAMFHPTEYSKSQISSSLLSKTVAAQRRPERATVKLLDTDQTVTSSVESAKIDEEIRQELVTTYEADGATIAQSHKKRAAASSTGGGSVGGDFKRRALESGSSSQQAGSAASVRSASPATVDSTESDQVSTTSHPRQQADAAEVTEDPLAEYEKLKQKATSNLSPENDEVLRQFYVYKADANAPTIEKPSVRIRLSEKLVQDGEKQVREAIYVTLDYQARKTTLTKKTKILSSGMDVNR